MRSFSRELAGLVAGVVLLASSGSAQCVGDCNGDGQVTVDEITRSVNILIRVEPPDRVCPAIDADGDGYVTVTELITAVDRALAGCPD